jgi:hypothetical protein
VKRVGKHILKPKSVSSLTILIEEFLKEWIPKIQDYGDDFHKKGPCSSPNEEDEEKICDKGHQSFKEEKEVPHDSIEG